MANFDINLRGNTASVDTAADKTAKKIASLRESVEKHGSGIANKFTELGGKVKAAFQAFPGAGVITAVLSPAVYLGGAIGKAFAGSVTGIMSATTAVGAFGAATTVATAGLNLIVAAVAATGAAAIGAGMAWTGMGLASMGSIKDAQKAASRLGMSVEAIQGFAFKGKLDIEELSGLLEKFEHHVGTGGGHDSPFARLGLDAAKLKAAKPEDALAMVADGFENIKNQADRVTLAMDIFGKSGVAALKLMQGGSAGIAASLAEAKSLGVVVAGNEARSVAEASAALSQMKQAMSGLGRTAAVTIAPFVKMVADGLTSVMKKVNEYRDTILKFAYSVEFTFKNLADYAHLFFGKMGLYVLQFANATIHVFTDVIPQAFQSLGAIMEAAFEHGFGEGFDRAVDAQIDKMKRAMERPEGRLEGHLRAQLAAEEKDLDLRKQKWLKEKMAALNVGPAGESNLGGAGSKDNAAVERGSVEAFKIIAGDQGDKMYKAQNETNGLLRKIAEILRTKGARAAREELMKADV